MFSKIIDSKFIVIALLTLSNLYFFFNDAIVCFIIFSFISLVFYSKQDTYIKNLLIDSAIFTNIFTLLLPPRKPFSGIQFSYYDYLFIENINFDPISYSDTFRYLGFHAVAKILLINENLANLNVALFFLNILVFFSIFRFFNLITKERSYLSFRIVLLALLVLIHLPREFNSIMGIGKLFLSGTAGFGNFGLRVFAPASFDLLMFFPLSMLLEKKLKLFLFSGLLISLMHYYLFMIMLIVFVAYLATVNEKNYLPASIVLTCFVFMLVNQIEVFQYLGEVISTLKKYSFININLIPAISFGTLFNNGLNNDFIYYLNFDDFKLYKPIFEKANFSPSLGVFNDEASIPIEKVFLFIFSIRIAKKEEIPMVSNFLKFGLYAFLISHVLYSLGIFSFQGIIYPWRIAHITSIVCFLIISSKLRINLFKKEYNYAKLLLLLFIPASFYIWNYYTEYKNDFNEKLASELLVASSEERILLPLSETKYLYHYGLPNVFVSSIHPIDWFNRDLMEEYFQRMEHYNAIYSMSSCTDIADYLYKESIKIDSLYFYEQSEITVGTCQIQIKFIEPK